MALSPIGHVVGGRTWPEDTLIQSLRNPDEQGRVVVFLWLLAHLADAPAQPQLQVVPFLPCDRASA